MDQKKSRRESILIIDDEEPICTLLKHFFEIEGYCVDFALNAEIGFEKYRIKPTSLVFVDIRMPGMGGVEFIKRAKKLQNQAKIIVMSAIESEDIKKICLEEGAIDFLTKPVDLELLSKLAFGLTRVK